MARKNRGGAGVIWTSDTLTPSLVAFPVVLATALGKLMQYEAAKVQDYARDNAPWKDRTTNARGGLFAKSNVNPTNVEIILYHTVPYGIFLEVKNSGEYAIIRPTLEVEGPRVMRSVRTLMKRMA